MRRAAIVLLAATMVAFANGIASAQSPTVSSLTEGDLEVLLDAASTFRKVPCAGARGITTEDGQRLIDLGLASEMKERFLANLSPWSADRARLEQLDPGKPGDVSAMAGIIHGDGAAPGASLDFRRFSAQVVLVAHYDALAAGCESPPALKDLLPRLRADAWAPVKVGEQDIADIGRDLDQAWNCFWKAVPAADRNSPDAIRAFVGANMDLEELRADAYEFAVNLKAPGDRDRAGRYLAGAPENASPEQQAHFFMGVFFGDVAPYRTLGDQVVASALGTYHMAGATSACRLTESTLSLIGKREPR